MDSAEYWRKERKRREDGLLDLTRSARREGGENCSYIDCAERDVAIVRAHNTL